MLRNFERFYLMAPIILRVISVFLLRRSCQSSRNYDDFSQFNKTRIFQTNFPFLTVGQLDLPATYYMHDSSHTNSWLYLLALLFRRAPTTCVRACVGVYALCVSFPPFSNLPFQLSGLLFLLLSQGQVLSKLKFTQACIQYYYTHVWVSMRTHKHHIVIALKKSSAALALIS